jgi:group I intron endonuclease
MGCVYLVRSPSGKGYVGVTKHDALTRWKAHVRESSYSNWSALHEAVRKYGFEAFVVETLFESNHWKELIAAERRLIAELGTKVPNGYNLTDGGEGCPGLPEEIEAARIRKIARALTGKPLSASHRAKLSSSHMGQSPPNKGKAHSAEARARMSEAAKRRWSRAEELEKMRAVRQSPEWRKMMRDQALRQHHGK